MATTYLNKTLSGTRTNGKKWTWSAWVKKTKNGIIQPLFYADDGSANYYTTIRFHDTNSIVFRNKYSSDQGYLITTSVYRDTNAWYHIVAVYDSDNSTSGNRMILYVNGNRITAYDNEAYPGSSAGSTINDGYEHRIGRGNQVDGSSYFDGIMSHVHFCDGYAYSASDFGQTDSVTGEWSIKTSPSVSYGTNGFFILKDGNSVTDQSGNSNNFTVGGGTLTNTEDCPSNVFATLNPLSQTGNFTYSGSELPTNGSTVFTGKSSNNYPGFFSTLAASAGKYYAEFKVTSAAQGDSMIGVSNGLWNNVALGGSAGSYGSQDYVYFGYNGQIYNNGSGSAYGSAISLNDIVQIALDCDNSAMYVGVNGTYQNSGVPTSGASKTGAVSLPTSTTGVWHFAVGDYGGDGVPVINCNFGNGYFGTTAISSEGTNASNIGKFEYDVPTGFTALSTKGLNE
jgi:hypothetical protein